MDKIDLIIDALECARNEIHDPTLWTDKVDKALAAARELREVNAELLEALKSVVAFCDEDMQHRVQTSREYDIKKLAQAAISKAEVTNKEWVGLTSDEVLTIWLSPDACKVPQCDKYHHFYVAIEAKLKELNK